MTFPQIRYRFNVVVVDGRNVALTRYTINLGVVQLSEMQKRVQRASSVLNTTPSAMHIREANGSALMTLRTL